MTPIGLLARADQGGIAAQSWSFARNMRPQKILVCWTEHTTRGHARPEIYEEFGEVRTCRRAPKAQDAQWLVEGMRSVFTIECFYGTEIPVEARRRGVLSFVQANPEMSGAEMCDVMIAPTDWRVDALQGRVHRLGFPTDPEVLPRRPLWTTRTLYHIASNAMCDRNGTELVLDACQCVTQDCQLLIRGGDHYARYGVQRIGNVDIVWLSHHSGMFFEAWDIDVDALILPRRYGGLCLPIQEAATLGLPIITLDLEPQNRWLPRNCLVPAHQISSESMRGGFFNIHGADPAAIAERIDMLLKNPILSRQLGEDCYDWAMSRSWSVMRPLYEELLCPSAS